jgi:anthranilate phosphoribosyltransferase
MNCLGPLANPVGVRFQLVGVYAAKLVMPIARALGELGAVRALVVHGCDGLDEITSAGPTDAALLADGVVRKLVIDPSEFAIQPPAAGALRGGEAAENAAILRAVLAGEPGACRDIVLLNAGAALWVAGAAEDLRAGFALARDSIDSGAARERLERLVEATNAVD